MDGGAALPRHFPWRVKLATPLAVARQNLGQAKRRQCLGDD